MILKNLARLLLVGGLLLVTAALDAPVQARPLAAPYTVTNCTEAGLLAALSSSNNINFNCSANPAVIPINQQITLTTSYIIDGGGRVVLDGQNKTRIFALEPYRELLLKNITLQNGHAVPGDHALRPGQGGAVLVGTWADATFDNVRFLNNRADAAGSVDLGNSNICEGGGALHLNGFNYVEVFNSTFVGNRALNGGAINNLTADLVVSNSTFENNVSVRANASDACGGGGAIYIDGAGPTSQGGQQLITITRSVFRGNTTDRNGGAIFLFTYPSGGNHGAYRDRGDSVTIDSSTFEGNRSETSQPGVESAGGGGAIDYQAASAPLDMKLTITRSTISGNHADYMGGGIWNVDAPLELYNVTIANNEAKNSKTSNDLARGSGGGIMFGNGGSYDGTGTRLVHVTLTGNSANYVSGGIGLWGINVTQARMGNSLIANNTAGVRVNNCAFTFINLGGNVQYPNKAAGDFDCSSSIRYGNPALSALGDYGGPTKTVQIGSGSAARDYGNPSYCSSGVTILDQRSYARNGACDSGAFEYGGQPLRPAGYLPMIQR